MKLISSYTGQQSWLVVFSQISCITVNGNFQIDIDHDLEYLPSLIEKSQRNWLQEIESNAKCKTLKLQNHRILFSLPKSVVFSFASPRLVIVNQLKAQLAEFS